MTMHSFGAHFIKASADRAEIFFSSSSGVSRLKVTIVPSSVSTVTPGNAVHDRCK